jgi:hypothetical protein
MQMGDAGGSEAPWAWPATSEAPNLTIIFGLNEAKGFTAEVPLLSLLPSPKPGIAVSGRTTQHFSAIHLYLNCYKSMCGEYQVFRR